MIEKDARLIALLGGILIVLGLFAAMVAYPGGYDFWGYYISSLGTVKAKNGGINVYWGLVV